MGAKLAKCCGSSNNVIDRQANRGYSSLTTRALNNYITTYSVLVAMTNMYCIKIDQHIKNIRAYPDDEIQRDNARARLIISEAETLLRTTNVNPQLEMIVLFNDQLLRLKELFRVMQ